MMVGHGHGATQAPAVGFDTSATPFAGPTGRERERRFALPGSDPDIEARYLAGKMVPGRTGRQAAWGRARGDGRPPRVVAPCTPYLMEGRTRQAAGSTSAAAASLYASPGRNGRSPASSRPTGSGKRDSQASPSA